VGRKGDEAYVVVHYRKKGNIKGQFTDNVPKPINGMKNDRENLKYLKKILQEKKLFVWMQFKV